MHWLIFDGDVDAVWIEDMNSVMDDNKTLTLPNSERIRLLDHSKLIVECFDLQYASPATISRCGCVWVDPQDIKYKPFYERWVKLRCGTDDAREVERSTLLQLFEKYVPDAVAFILDGVENGEIGNPCDQVIPVTALNMVRQLCSLYDAYATDATGRLTAEAMESVFVFTCVWGLGGALMGKSRQRFDVFVKGNSSAPLPASSLYENYFDIEKARWNAWTERVKAYGLQNDIGEVQIGRASV